MSGQLVSLKVHNLHFEWKFNCFYILIYQGVHKSKVFTWPDLTLLGDSIAGVETLPHYFGLDRDVVLYRVWFSGS